MDNYPTYELCQQWNMRPFIPLNDKSAIALKNLPKGVDAFNHKGEPICPGGIPYAYWGSSYGKGHKYRCWFAAHKKESPCHCSNSSYGRTVHIKPDDDLRLFPAVSRQSETFREKLKQRSGAERTNKRLFNDYDIEEGGSRSTKHRFFRSIIAGINIHLDAWLKNTDVKLMTLLEVVLPKASA